MLGTNVPTKLEFALSRALSELGNHPIGSEDYMRTLDVVIKLHKLAEEEKPEKVSKDTVATIAANLLGIFMIIRHEDVNVIASRAMGLVMRTK